MCSSCYLLAVISAGSAPENQQQRRNAISPGRDACTHSLQCTPRPGIFIPKQKRMLQSTTRWGHPVKASAPQGFPHPLLQCFPLNSIKAKFILIPPSVADVFVKAVSLLPYGVCQIQFQQGLCLSTFLPACPKNILAVHLRCCLSCKAVNSVFSLSASQSFLSAQPLCFLTSSSLGTQAQPVPACAFKDFSLQNVQPRWTPLPLRTVSSGSLSVVAVWVYP